MPANAVAGQGVTFASTSCPADGWCIAVGDYLALTGSTYYEPGLIVSESGGTWSAGGGASARQRRRRSAGVPPVGGLHRRRRHVWRWVGTSTPRVRRRVWSSSCSTARGRRSEVSPPRRRRDHRVDGLRATDGGDVSLGRIVHGRGPLQPQHRRGAGAPRHRGRPEAGTRRRHLSPVTASGSQFLSLACPAAGSCVAAGTYQIGGIQQGFVDTLSAGTWTGTALPDPAGHLVVGVDRQQRPVGGVRRRQRLCGRGHHLRRQLRRPPRHAVGRDVDRRRGADTRRHPLHGRATDLGGVHRRHRLRGHGLLPRVRGRAGPHRHPGVGDLDPVHGADPGRDTGGSRHRDPRRRLPGRGDLRRRRPVRRERHGQRSVLEPQRRGRGS